MSLTHKTSLLLSVFLAATLAQPATAGMHDREGMYLGLELGVAEQDDVRLNGSDNDVPTRCDQVLRAIPGATGFLDLSNADCARGQDTWHNRVDVGTGVIAGLQAGWMFGHFRAEVEYLYRAHSDGERKNIAGILGGKDAELVAGLQGLDKLSSHSVFANLYYDFMSDSKFTPYIGAGIGFSEIDFTYDALFQRNNDPAKLGPTTPDVAAGTTTDTDDELSDEVFGYQFMVGSDYAIDENWSIGLKLRYQDFDDVKDSARWDRLRGHASVIQNEDNPNPEDYVTYKIKTDDVEVWAASLNLKYRF